MRVASCGPLPTSSIPSAVTAQRDIKTRLLSNGRSDQGGAFVPVAASLGNVVMEMVAGCPTRLWAAAWSTASSRRVAREGKQHATGLAQLDTLLQACA
eukprot:CAMPEP_0198210242 /NCGR_PEP_ID=MMETSP1445-20131203/19984_1 /TAXON_ID=36898 /ORGANISM="Pyramimonas sp., Strain CCMP2087" /LENGTH=97 /DNA_ID=CAMNT_0043884257 /DNA_START=591 /DNA_END=884 /DNA_ORIENTATION=-